MKRLLICLCFIAVAACAENHENNAPITEIPSARNVLFGYPALTEAGRLNLLVEIPAGTQQKWEAMKSGDGLKWDRKNGELRVIKYLPYPGNYGMVPRTLLPSSAGGDGDPLDVLLLGASAKRGSIITVKPIGVLQLLDDGEQDDKILAVPFTGSLSEIDSLAELDEKYPGITTIIETWFTNYKGPGRMQSKGYAETEAARQMIDIASNAFEAAHPNTATQ